VLLFEYELRNYGIGHFEIKRRKKNQMNEILIHEKVNHTGKQDGESFLSGQDFEHEHTMLFMV
jgi:hypothetical protein